MPRLDRLLSARYAGAEFVDADGSYRLWVTGPLDVEVVGFVAERMREASVADGEWTIHAARFSRRDRVRLMTGSSGATGGERVDRLLP